MKSKGFTLVELFVTIAIALLLGSAAVLGYNSVQERLALDRSAFKLAQDIRRAQEMAMAQEAYEGEVSHGGYGIYLSATLPDSYIFFTDLPQGDSNPNKKYDPGTEKIKELFYESGVEIKDLVDADYCVNIIFAPPHPYLYLKDNDGEDLGNEISIVISLKKDPSATRTVHVNKAGLIYVEN